MATNNNINNNNNDNSSNLNNNSKGLASKPHSSTILWTPPMINYALWRNGTRISELNLANLKNWTLQTLRIEPCKH